MKAELVTYTQDAERLIANIAVVCTGREMPRNPEKLLKDLYESGHMSVFEHVSFTFHISGISRACSHQLVRFRLASFTQRSQRYTVGSDYVLPALGDMQHRAEAYLDRGQELYQEMLSQGIPAEDARFILPNATVTELYMTMNARELIHACELRLCNRAQWEIRELFLRIKELVPYKHLSEFMMPKCERLGYCNERKSCGRY